MTHHAAEHVREFKCQFKSAVAAHTQTADDASGTLSLRVEMGVYKTYNVLNNV